MNEDTREQTMVRKMFREAGRDDLADSVRFEGGWAVFSQALSTEDRLLAEEIVAGALKPLATNPEPEKP